MLILITHEGVMLTVETEQGRGDDRRVNLAIPTNDAKTEFRESRIILAPAEVNELIYMLRE